jgi:hypothetical protein
MLLGMPSKSDRAEVFTPAPMTIREKTAPVTAAMEAPLMSGLVRSRLLLQWQEGSHESAHGQKKAVPSWHATATAAHAYDGIGSRGLGSWDVIENSKEDLQREAAFPSLS